ncbi:MAG: DUF3837 family protein [Lachnospiraceae bacterium]|nr:DUF3837 family protein [Lachnospiraceae bacterium]
MVPVLAKNAIILKSDADTSVMLGNYEMAYACGLLSKLTDTAIPVFDSPVELQQRLLSVLEHYEPADIHEKNIIRILHDYIPDDTWNKDTEKLYHMGLEETDPWVIK